MSDRGESLKRAIRRQQRARMIRHAEGIASEIDVTYVPRRLWAVRNHKNLTRCSCAMCGNPRKWRGEVTIQEKRHDRADQEMN